MPYSQYTSLRAIKQKFGIQIETKILFDAALSIAPSEWLKETLRKMLAHQVALFSEKSRSEALVFPILVEAKEVTNGLVCLYSGAFIDAEKEKGLNVNGECDFVLGLGKQNLELEAPIFCVLEAKDNDIESGVPQCIAQLIGSQLFNEQDGFSMPVIYGAVTTGVEWLFLKLEGKTITMDNQRYYIENLPKLLGIIHAIIQQFV
jgi:hypothetical protein